MTTDAGSMHLLPPKPGTCPICAVDHPDEAPHNAQSLYYQYRFYARRQRWPTWADAVAHCSEETRDAWEEQLRDYNAWTEPEDGQPIADPPSESINQIVAFEGYKPTIIKGTKNEEA